MVTPERIKMTAEAFSALPETTQLTELIGGELNVSPAPIPAHQRASHRLVILLDSLIPDGEVFYAPIDVYLDEKNIPQPDIAWVAGNSKCVIIPKRLEGPPDLVVEVLSPGTAKQDKSEKFLLYERSRVRECWIADPIGLYLEVWVLQAEHYQRHGVYGSGDQFISPVLGDKTVELTGIFD